jgi:uncharacterized protein YegJ (DUF2314 family)
LATPSSVASSRSSSQGGGRRKSPRPPDAFAELAILTDKPRRALDAYTDAAAVAARLGPEHCGAACPMVRDTLRDKTKSTLEIVSTGDWVLPPADTLPYATRSLTDEERASVVRRPWVVAVRIRGRATSDQVVARTGFATAALVAQELGALVYDEEVRRIESAAQFATRAIVTPPGAPAFRTDHVAVQLYTQEDGTARLLTLGMRRFGAPDLEIKGASMHAGRKLAAVLNALCAKLAAGEDDLPMTVTVEDMVRARADADPASTRGRDSDARAPGAPPSRPAVLDFVAPNPPHTAGDPDNEIVSVVPAGTDSPRDPLRAFDAIVEGLFGKIDVVIVDEANDPRLADVAKRARARLASALSRWKKEQALGTTMMVKLPFAYEPPEGADAARAYEWMWVRVTSFDERSISGTLANSPAYVPELAMGSSVRGKRSEVADVLFRLADGGLEGGESIRILEARAR